MSTPPVDLWNFPCQFPIKIMGINTPELINEVCAIVTAHAPSFVAASDITIKPSSNAKYLAITATIVAESKAQLDTIYQALNRHSLVKVTL